MVKNISSEIINSELVIHESMNQIISEFWVDFHFSNDNFDN